MSNDEKMSTFDHYCQVSTCMGVIDWYMARHICGKTFWALLLILCTSLTIWQTWGTVREFANEQPFKTTVSKEIVDEGLIFPDVTVCNFNRIKQSLIDRNGVDPMVLIYIFHLFPITYDLPNWFAKQNISDLEKVWQNFSDVFGLTPLQVLQKYGHSAEDTFFDVSVNSGTKKILPKEMREVFTVYGRCWLIKPDTRQDFPGPTGGMKMLLNPLLNEYLKQGALSNYLQEGIVLSIGYIHEAFISQPIYIAPGTAASISLKLFENTVTVPDPPLRKPRCNTKAMLNLVNETYSPMNCIFDCFMQAVHKICNCVFIGRTLKPYPLCNIGQMYTCVFQRSAQDDTNVVWNSKILDLIHICKKNCQISCEPSFSIESTMTIASYPNGKARGAMNKVLVEKGFVESDKVEEILDQSISVDIFFPYPELYKSDTSESTPIFTFIGNLGGQLGLWTGISLLTIVQLGYYIVVGCLNSWCQKRDEKLMKEK